MIQRTLVSFLFRIYTHRCYNFELKKIKSSKANDVSLNKKKINYNKLFVIFPYRQRLNLEFQSNDILILKENELQR